MRFALNSSWRTAVSASLHCLTGCAIGEVLGLIIATAFGWSNAVSIVLAVVLSFVTGYGLSLRPVVRHGVALRRAMLIVAAADTLSITVMELTDNAVEIAIPGALNAGLNNALFWTTMPLSLGAAFLVAVPVNAWLLSRGKGHALTHAYHH